MNTAGKPSETLWPSSKGDNMTDLEILIAYILENEATHYEESGQPADHVYAVALRLQATMQSQTPSN